MEEEGEERRMMCFMSSSSFFVMLICALWPKMHLKCNAVTFDTGIFFCNNCASAM